MEIGKKGVFDVKNQYINFKNWINWRFGVLLLC